MDYTEKSQEELKRILEELEETKDLLQDELDDEDMKIEYDETVAEIEKVKSAMETSVPEPAMEKMEIEEKVEEEEIVEAPQENMSSEELKSVVNPDLFFSRGGTTKYEFGIGGTLAGAVVGGYVGYKIGRARPQKTGFDTEKRIFNRAKSEYQQRMKKKDPNIQDVSYEEVTERESAYPYAKGGDVKFRKLAKGKNFDIITDEGRFEIEMGAFGMPKNIIVDGTRKDINTNPIAKKYRVEIQDYLDANYAKGGYIEKELEGYKGMYDYAIANNFTPSQLADELEFTTGLKDERDKKFYNYLKNLTRMFPDKPLSEFAKGGEIQDFLVLHTKMKSEDFIKKHNLSKYEYEIDESDYDGFSRINFETYPSNYDFVNDKSVKEFYFEPYEEYAKGGMTEKRIYAIDKRNFRSKNLLNTLDDEKFMDIAENEGLVWSSMDKFLNSNEYNEEGDNLNFREISVDNVHYAKGGKVKDKYAVGIRLFTEDEDDDSTGYGYIHIYANSPEEDCPKVMSM